MFCDEALDAIEAIAADELTPDPRVARIWRPAELRGGAGRRALAEAELKLPRRPGGRHRVHVADDGARTGARGGATTSSSTSIQRRERAVLMVVLVGVWSAAESPGLAAVSNDASICSAPAS